MSVENVTLSKKDFYFTYEELKLIYIIISYNKYTGFLLYLWGIETPRCCKLRLACAEHFYFTYEELKPSIKQAFDLLEKDFYFTYEELKLQKIQNSGLQNFAFLLYLWGIET